MAEELLVHSGSKEKKYKTLLSQIKALLTGETNQVSNLANVTAAIQETFSFLWVGFYIATDAKTLELGPFQGPIACTRIEIGKGVCGTAFKTKKTQLVANVDTFPGHIACSSKSKSEIVVPLLRNDDTVWAVLDIDSEYLNHFNSTDIHALEELCSYLSSQKNGWK